jgi:uncharacterized integral membrane protein
MQNLWLKIKIWTKITVFTALFIYVILFLANNANKNLTVWYWINEEYPTTVVRLILITLLAGVAGTLLVGTVTRTLRQIRELRTRSHMAQMQQDVAHLKSRAGMLQTKPLPGEQQTIAPPPSQI